MGTLLRKELLEQWRTYRFLIVAVVLVFFGLTSPLLARYTPELMKSVPGVPPELAAVIPPPTVADAVGQYVKNLAQFGILLALFIPMAAVAQEKERGTAAMVLSKPVRRSSFLFAKFVALALVFLAGLLLAALAAYYYTGVLFQWLDVGPYAALNGLLFVYLLFFMTLSLLASTLARTQFAAVGMALVFFILEAIVAAAIPALGRYMPGALISWGTAMLLGLGSAPSMQTAAWGAVAVCLAVIVAVLLGAWVSLQRQEI